MLSLETKQKSSLAALYKTQWQIWTLLEAPHLWILPALQHLDIRLLPVARGSAACTPTKAAPTRPEKQHVARNWTFVLDGASGEKTNLQQMTSVTETDCWMLHRCNPTHLLTLSPPQQFYNWLDLKYANIISKPITTHINTVMIWSNKTSKIF